MEEILSYEDFKEELKQRIQEQADGYSAVERRIEINNGVYQEKLICESKEDNLVPAVPLKTLYSVYLQIGKSKELSFCGTGKCRMESGVAEISSSYAYVQFCISCTCRNMGRRK